MTTTDTIPCTDFQLDAILLKSGQHGNTFHGEACAVEAACVAAACVPELREKYGAAPFTDDHPSICRVVRAFVISWNDNLPDDDTRTRILKFRSALDEGITHGPACGHWRDYVCDCDVSEYAQTSAMREGGTFETTALCWSPAELELLAMFVIAAKNDAAAASTGSTPEEADRD